MSHDQAVRGAEKSLLIDNAAQVLGVSRRTIYYRIHEGRLQTIRTRCGSQRVLVSSIELLLRASGRPEPGGGSEGTSGQTSETKPLTLEIQSLSRDT
jgi:excisionase family DNA binding protein